MAKLRWDQVNERFYEAGVDRGVLYLSDSSGVPWNGLTALEEDFGDDITTPAYFDGLKYSDIQSIGDYVAKLTAFTYPDEFLEYEGIIELGNGLFVDGQGFKTFGLSYRTLVGNVLDGTNHAYKIHLVYNLTAIPDTINYTTLSDSLEPVQFSWTITAIPEQIPNYRPTAHVIFDSRFLNADLLSDLEDIIYGVDGVEGGVEVTIVDGGTASSSGVDIIDGGTASSSGTDLIDGNLTDSTTTYDGLTPTSAGTGVLDGGVSSSAGTGTVDGTYEEEQQQQQEILSVDARLPSLEELVAFIFFWNPMYIVPQPVTGLAQLLAGSGDLTMTNVAGIFSALPSTRLVQTSIEGFYELV